MAVTSVDIDTDLLQAAKESFGVRTNKDAIDLALRDAVARRRQLAAIDTLIGLDLETDPHPLHPEG